MSKYKAETCAAQVSHSITLRFLLIIFIAFHAYNFILEYVDELIFAIPLFLIVIILLMIGLQTYVPNKVVQIYRILYEECDPYMAELTLTYFLEKKKRYRDMMFPFKMQCVLYQGDMERYEKGIEKAEMLKEKTLITRYRWIFQINDAAYHEDLERLMQLKQEIEAYQVKRNNELKYRDILLEKASFEIAFLKEDKEYLEHVFLPKEVNETYLFERLTHKYNKAKACLLLNRSEEAIELFQEVAELGNKLYLVDKANQQLIRLQTEMHGDQENTRNIH